MDGADCVRLRRPRNLHAGTMSGYDDVKGQRDSGGRGACSFRLFSWMDLIFQERGMHRRSCRCGECEGMIKECLLIMREDSLST